MVKKRNIEESNIGISLSNKELERYSRHLNLAEFTESKQIKLKNSKVLVIGAGGLGSSLLLYLAAAGVGYIDIIDFDAVDSSNLQRQIIHQEKNIGKNKALSAKEQMLALNSFVNVNAITAAFNESNSSIVKNYHLLIVTADDYLTRSTANKAAFKYKTKQIVAASVAYESWITTFDPLNKNSPCYNCLHNNLEINKIKKAKDIGVFAPMVGMFGTMQAIEAIRELLNLNNSLVSTLRVYNVLSNKTTDFKLKKSSNCKICNSY